MNPGSGKRLNLDFASFYLPLFRPPLFWQGRLLAFRGGRLFYQGEVGPLVAAGGVPDNQVQRLERVTYGQVKSSW